MRRVRRGFVLGAAVLLVAAAAGAAEQVYRWVDDNGVVNFSTQPRPGAEPVRLEPGPAVDLDVPSAAAGGSGTAEGTRATAADSGYRVAITNLRDDEVVWNDARRLELRFDIRPPLGSRPGLRLEVFVDGHRRAVISGGDRVMLQDIDRGTHRVWAELVGADGRRLAASDTLTVHHKQHSVQRPTREVELEGAALPGGVRPPQGTSP